MGLKVGGGGGGGTNIPLPPPPPIKKWGAHAPCPAYNANASIGLLTTARLATGSSTSGMGRVVSSPQVYHRLIRSGQVSVKRAHSELLL